MNDLQKHIIHTLDYFSFFKYAPTIDEVYTFLPIKIKKSALKNELAILIRKKAVQCITLDSGENPRYTLGEYNISVQNSKFKIQNSVNKIRKVQRFTQILSCFPQVKLIGLSGSVAMMNAEKDDDIDLFIITAKNRMWTARIIGIFIAHIMGIRRRRGEQNVENKICLNLFFDENDLRLPSAKMTEYGAHEVLQMKPLINKDNMYRKFIHTNRWVFQWFPNAKVHKQIPLLLKEGGTRRVGWLKTILSRILFLQQKEGSRIGMYSERLLRYFQLSIIRRHKTTEIISDTQLWFFPDDFEKRVKKILYKRK